MIVVIGLGGDMTVKTQIDGRRQRRLLAVDAMLTEKDYFGRGRGHNLRHRSSSVGRVYCAMGLLYHS
jgi:hypothetical protein